MSKRSVEVVITHNPLSQDLSMKLIYRGYTYEHGARALQPYRKPRSLNWRFCAPGETYGDTNAAESVYARPHALNWRYVMAMGE
jgi:hypothetical protein